MSFYISIEGKTLKIGKYVIIGRGSPFDNLLPFKDIGRAHAKVLEQGRNYYIKDLGTETGTFVNGKKIKPKTLVKITPEDKISLGKRELKFMLNFEEGAFETVRRFKSLDQPTNFWSLFLIIFTTSLIYTSIKEGSVGIGPVFMSLTFAMLTSLFAMFLTKISESNKLMISDIFIGEKGLTLHYPESNMSIQYFDIDKIYETYGGMVIIAHDEKFKITKINNYDKLLKFFKNNYPEKFSRSDKHLQLLTVSLVIITVMVSFSFDHITKNMDLTANILVELTIYCSAFTLATFFYFNEKLIKRYFLVNKANMKTFKKSLAVGISIFALMSAFGIYDYKYIALQKKHIKSCQQGNALSCQNINLYMVKRQKKKKFNVIKISETACDLGSKRACIFLDRTLIEPSSKSGRMPASIPSSK